MKNLYFCILLGFVCILLYLPVEAAGKAVANEKLVITADMLWEYSHILMDKKDYATAKVELKRFEYFFPADQRISQARLDIGLCLFHTGQYLEAAKICNKIMLEEPLGDVGEDSCFLQSLCFEKIGNLGYAKLVLHNYLKLIQAKSLINKQDIDKNNQDRIYFHLGRISLAQGEKTADISAFKKAEESFFKISSDGVRKYKVGKYLAAIESIKNFSKKSPGVAGCLALIPGAGFLYTHRFQDAFAALLVNGGLAAATCKAWDQDNKALAGLLSIFGSGFYTGSIYGSISSTHKYNRTALLKLLSDQVSLSPVFGDQEYGIIFRIPF